MLIVRDIMTTKLLTVTPDDSLAHAANLFRQHKFHHLPVVRTVNVVSSQHLDDEKPRKGFLLEGLLTSQDIDMASALGERDDDPRVATMRLGTINPTPLLIRLKAEGIQFSFGSPLTEGEAYV